MALRLKRAPTIGFAMGLGRGFEHLGRLDVFLSPEETRKLRRRISYEAAKIVKRQARKLYRTGGAGGQPLSDLTVHGTTASAGKGHDTKLFKTGNLANSVEIFAAGVQQVGDARRWVENGPGFEVLIGTSVLSPDGVKAAVHEDGVEMAVTDKIRQFFRARFEIRLKPDTTVIRIPARPIYLAVVDGVQVQIQAVADKAVTEIASARGPGPRALAESEFMRVIERLRRQFSRGGALRSGRR